MRLLHSNHQKIDIINFRYFFEQENSIYIILQDFSAFLVKNITPADIYKLSSNRSKSTSVLYFEFKGYTLSCQLCKGRGYIDWVTNITESPLKTTDCETFERDDKLINKAVIKYLTDVEHIVHYSKPFLPPQTMYCKRCSGSGCNMLTHKIKDLKGEI